VIAVGAHEWAGLAGLSGPRSLVLVGATVIVGLALLFAGAFRRGWPAATVVVVCGVATLFWLVVAPIWLARRAPPQSRSVRAVAGCVVLVGAWVAVVQLQARSPWLVLAAMAVVWIADSAAYFTGRAFGRRKLAPHVSPGKSWEGVYGGLAAVALYALVVATLLFRARHPAVASASAIAALVLCAVALAALSVVGDLVESLLKRSAGVKDSGTLLPGHGGVLDRIDALLAAMPPSALIAAALPR
jgi:phosphatidate cytidylyltransferase